MVVGNASHESVGAYAYAKEDGGCDSGDGGEFGSRGVNAGSKDGDGGGDGDSGDDDDCDDDDSSWLSFMVVC